jgi:hypothetical protein
MSYRRLEGLVAWMVETIALIVVLAAAILLGVGVSVVAAMYLLYNAGQITQDPLAFQFLWAAVRYAVITAAVLVLIGGKVLGLGRHGNFIGAYLACLFAYSYLMPLVASALLILFVQAVVSPVFGIDAWQAWRPTLHCVLAVLGAIVGFWAMYEDRHTLYDESPLLPARYRGPRGSLRTGGMVGGQMMSGLGERWSDSDDSGGGDSD